MEFDPRSGLTGKWIVGVGAAGLLGAIGAVSMVIGQTRLGRGASRIVFEGTPAVLLAAGILSLALYLHFHFFWGTNTKADRLTNFGERLSSIAAAAFIFAGVWVHLSR